MKASYKSSLALTVTALALSVASDANAYTLFSGIDPNNTESVLASTPNSSSAEASFLARLVGTGTETFEGQSGSGPLTLSFSGAGNATLTGGGSVGTNSPGSTNGLGRYSAPGGTRFFEVSAGLANNFSVVFSQDIAAFGFYGIDIGDFNGTLQLQLLNSLNTQVGLLSVPAAPPATANASVLYFGVLADNSAENFTRLNFLTTGGSGDVFAFDNFTIGAPAQVIPPRTIPEPASLLLFASALLGLGVIRRRRR